MSVDTIRLVGIGLLVFGGITSILGAFFSSTFLKIYAVLFYLVGWGTLGYSIFENWPREERVHKIEHLQSEIPKEVNLRKLDPQLHYRNIDLKDANSISYSDGSLKIFFTQKHLIGSDNLTTWTVKLQDNSIKSMSRSDN